VTDINNFNKANNPLPS